MCSSARGGATRAAAPPATRAAARQHASQPAAGSPAPPASPAGPPAQAWAPSSAAAPRPRAGRACSPAPIHPPPPAHHCLPPAFPLPAPQRPPPLPRRGACPPSEPARCRCCCAAPARPAKSGAVRSGACRARHEPGAGCWSQVVSKKERPKAVTATSSLHAHRLPCNTLPGPCAEEHCRKPAPPLPQPARFLTHPCSVSPPWPALWQSLGEHTPQPLPLQQNIIARELTQKLTSKGSGLGSAGAPSSRLNRTASRSA